MRFGHRFSGSCEPQYFIHLHKQSILWLLIVRDLNSCQAHYSFHSFSFVSPVYRSEVLPAAAKIAATGDLQLANRALTVAIDISTFLWISDTATISKLSGWLNEARAIQTLTGKKQVVQLEVYNLPDRDCSAGAVREISLL